MDNEAIRAELNKVRDEIRKLKGDFLSKKNVKTYKATRNSKQEARTTNLIEHS